MKAVALVTDILFSSKIKEAAKASGAEITFVRTEGDFVRAITDIAPQVIILDLNLRTGDALAISRAVHFPPNSRVVAFLSHVQKELFAEAQAAGISEVNARSQFVSLLPKLFFA